MDEQMALSLREHPEDREAWAVAGDWLVERDDPRGQLVLAQLRGLDGHDLTRAHPELFLPPDLGGEDDPYPPEVGIGWGFGYWRRLLVASDPDRLPGVLSSLLAHPSAAFLQEIDLRPPEDAPDWAPTWSELPEGAWSLLTAERRESLRRVSIGPPPAYRAFEAAIGDLTELWWAAPRLTHLFVHGREIELGKIAAFHLRELVLCSDALPPATVFRTGRAYLPALERLELWLGASEYGECCSDIELTWLLAGQNAPNLVHLGLKNSALADELPILLACSAVLPRLRTLDLSFGNMRDEGAAELLEQASRFAHLEDLILDHNHIEDPHLVERLRRVLPRARIGIQEGEDDFVGYTIGLHGQERY